jgi:hypothetical protein
MADREGFEPPVRFPVRRISSAVRSTTPPPVRGRQIKYLRPCRGARPPSAQGPAGGRPGCDQFSRPSPPPAGSGEASSAVPRKALRKKSNSIPHFWPKPLQKNDNRLYSRRRETALNGPIPALDDLPRRRLRREGVAIDPPSQTAVPMSKLPAPVQRGAMTGLRLSLGKRRWAALHRLLPFGTSSP